MRDVKRERTFNNVRFILDLVVLVVNALLDCEIIVDDVLSHTQVITDDRLRTIVHQ